MPLAAKRVFLITIAGGLFCGALAGALLALTRDLPQIRSLETFRPSAITRVYAADDTLLAELYAEKRDPIPLPDIPSALKQALITTEDRNYYRHHGVDLKAIARAIVRDVLAGEFVEGASTITQQLAKTLFLTPRKSLTRKLKEAVLAIQIERRYTKDEILALYLNQVYFGSGAYGVAMASKTFFGKPPSQLTLAECALIAGMPKAPSRYSPLTNPSLAVKRRNIVLLQMHRRGLITDAAHEAARSQPITVAPPPNGRRAPYFVDYILPLLEAELGESNLYRGGLRIYTTLSQKLQSAAESAVKRGTDALAGRMAAGGHSSPSPQGALVALDLQSGGILAMVGGCDYRKSAFNRAVAALRQPGSAFKPLIYAQALAQGYTQSSLVLDAPAVFPGGSGARDWQPENFSRTYLGEIPLRTALARSKNIPAVRLLQSLGIERVVGFCRKAGIDTPLRPDLSLALGTSETRLMDLTAAYGMFAAGGRHTAPWGVMEVRDASGTVIWRARPRRKLIMSAENAAVMTDMLHAVVREGTGRAAGSLGRPVGGKTGTTDQYKDALFVGFSPFIAAGVWVGLDRHAAMGPGETGARAALPIWIDFMETALDGRPYESFAVPENTCRVLIDPVTGGRLPENASEGVRALFLQGTEPPF